MAKRITPKCHEPYCSQDCTYGIKQGIGGCTDHVAMLERRFGSKRRPIIEFNTKDWDPKIWR